MIFLGFSGNKKTGGRMHFSPRLGWRVPANRRYAGCAHYKGATIMLTSTGLSTGATFPMGWAILLIVVGFFALALPFEAGIAIAIVVAALVIVAGIAHLAGTL